MIDRTVAGISVTMNETFEPDTISFEQRYIIATRITEQLFVVASFFAAPLPLLADIERLITRCNVDLFPDLLRNLFAMMFYTCQFPPTAKWHLRAILRVTLSSSRPWRIFYVARGVACINKFLLFGATADRHLRRT